VIANLASLAIMVAALLFMISVPLAESEAARSLRRGAAFCFVMAFVPAIVVCLLAPIAKNIKPAGAVSSFLAICGSVAIFGILAFAAYGYLDIRGRMRNRQPRPHAEHAAYVKRRPSEHGDQHEGREHPKDANE